MSDFNALQEACHSMSEVHVAMRNVRKEFNDRRLEVENYVRFVRHLLIDDVRLHMSAGNVDGVMVESFDEDEDDIDLYDMGKALKSLKASIVLILYNLVESTVCNAIQDIFDEIEDHGVDFDKCSKELRVVILKNMKNHKPNDLVEVLQSISLNLAVHTFRRDKIVSGNVDARLIRDIAKDYGFESSNRFDGTILLSVKNSRNDLAHGVKSFEEVGRNLGGSELVEWTESVVKYLDVVVENVERFLDSRKYLADS